MTSSSSNSVTGNDRTPEVKCQSILIVDDDRAFARIVQKLLRKYSYHTHCVFSGKAAKQWLNKNRCTLMLLDFHLPDMTGLEIIKSLDKKKDNIPYIMLTAEDDTKLAVKFMKFGARDYLVKEKGIFDLLPGVITQVLEQIETEERLKKSQQEISALLSGTRSVLKHHKFEKAAEILFNSCKSLIGATAGFIALPNENFVFFLDPGELKCNIEPAMLMPTHGLRKEAFYSGKTMYENHFRGSKWAKHLPAGHVHLDNVLISPLVTDKKTVGFFCLVNKKSTFDDNDAKMATAFTELAAVALQNSKTLEFLKNSERNARQLFEYSPNGLWVEDYRGAKNYLEELERKGIHDFDDYFKKNPDSLKACAQKIQVLDVNRTALNMYQATSKKELLGNLDKTFTKKSFDNFKDEMVAIACGRNHFEHEAEVKTLSGEIRNVFLRLSIQQTKENENDYSNVLVSTIDITQRKLAEEALKQSHRETEQLLTAISSILIGVGADNKVTRWNEAAENNFGISKSHALGERFSTLKIKWDWNIVCEQIKQCRNKKQPTNINDIQYTHKNGSEGFLNIIINPLTQQQTEKISGYLLLAYDITNRKILENQLAQAQKLESIGQLAAGIAHEINTPMQYINDNTTFLKKAFTHYNSLVQETRRLLEKTNDANPDNDFQQKLTNLLKQSELDFLLNETPQAIEETLTGIERVTKIVKAMKEFSHPGQEDKTFIDINKAIESTIAISKNEYKYVADLKTDFDRKLPRVECLPGEFNQVILNIVINATHAIKDVVEQDWNKKGTITITTKQEDNWAVIQIADTGNGIPEKIRTKVFDPFFTTKEVGKGTGQGLAISHDVIVVKHKGTLTFESEMGKGTTFTIRLPITQTN